MKMEKVKADTLRPVQGIETHTVKRVGILHY